MELAVIFIVLVYRLYIAMCVSTTEMLAGGRVVRARLNG